MGGQKYYRSRSFFREQNGENSRIRVSEIEKTDRLTDRQTQNEREELIQKERPKDWFLDRGKAIASEIVRIEKYNEQLNYKTKYSKVNLDKLFEKIKNVNRENNKQIKKKKWLENQNTFKL